MTATIHFTPHFFTGASQAAHDNWKMQEHGRTKAAHDRFFGLPYNPDRWSYYYRSAFTALAFKAGYQHEWRRLEREMA